MTTYTTTMYSGGPWMIILLLLFFIVFASLGVMAVTMSDHAMTSHPTQISHIENCFNGGGNISNWFTGRNGRFLQFCNDGGKNNYFRVSECDGLERVIVTQFKQAIRKLPKYLKNGPYIPTDPPPCE